MLELGLPGVFAGPEPALFVLGFDLLGGALDFEFVRGVRGFELREDIVG